MSAEPARFDEARRRLQARPAEPAARVDPFDVLRGDLDRVSATVGLMLEAHPGRHSLALFDQSLEVARGLLTVAEKDNS